MKWRARCMFCGYEVTGNRRWRIEDTMKLHVRGQHPEEYKEVREHNKNIMRQIGKLKEQKKKWRILVPEEAEEST